MTAHVTPKEMRVKLENALDAESVIMCSELCAAYDVDGESPAAVVHPQTAQHVAQLLRHCAEGGWAAIPWGGGTGMRMGNVPRAYDLAIDLTWMDKVVDFDADNLTLVAEPGCTLASLEEILQTKGLFLPLDLPMSERVTLGGAVASNAFGPSRLRYGSARDFTLGMEVVLTTGEIVELGGKTVKNVAGYDLTRLFVGSYGTLGIITRVTCRLLPLPAASETVLLGFVGVEEALACAARILDSSLLPTRLDLLTERPAHADPQVTHSLVVGIDGSEETVERQVRDFETLGRNGGARCASRLTGQAVEHIRKSVRDGPAIGRCPLVLRAGLPISAVQSFWTGISELGSRFPLSLAQWARVGLGVVYVLADGESDALLGAAQEAQVLARRLGGYAVAERIPSSLKESLDVWGDPRADWPLMKALKEKYDPKHILSPGRFIGRL